MPLANELSIVGAKFDQVGKKASGFGSTISNIGRTEAIVAAAGLAAFGAASVKAALGDEQSQRLLATSLKNTTGATAEQIAATEKFITAQQNATGIIDDDLRPALSQLLRATGDSAKAQDLLKVAMDTSVARGIPLQNVAVALSKAYNGNVSGLQRLGIQTKDASGKTLSFAQVVEQLRQKMGGSAAAAADTLQGKLNILKGRFEDIEENVGGALIPKIESFASGVDKAFTGFQRFNDATGGFAGKVALVAAGLPVAVFALGKIDALGTAIAGSYAKLGTVFSTTAAEAEAGATANATLAESEVAVGANAAAATPLVAGLGGAVLAIGAGFIAGKVAGDKINDVLIGTKPNVDRLHASLLDLANGTRGAFDVKKLVGDLGSQVGSDTINPLKGLSVFTTDIRGAHQAKADIDALNKAFQDMLATQGPEKTNRAIGLLGQQIIGQHGNYGRFIGDLEPTFAKLDLVRASATDAGGAIEQSGAAADRGKFGYLGLAASVKTATDALAAIDQQASQPLTLAIDVRSAQSSVADAVSELLHPTDTGGGGGGGSTQSATAKALEQAQKELTLRDARRAVGDATRGVRDAEEHLVQARKDQTVATREVEQAQRNLSTVLKGVKADSDAARVATEQLTTAQNAAKGSALDVAAAKRAVQQAKSDNPLLGLAVSEAQRQLTASRQAAADNAQFGDPADQAALNDQVRRDQIALNDARLAASAGDEAVQRAELALSDAQVAAKQKTKDLSEAQRVHNGVLHGFPKTSKEAQTALKDLTTAQDTARQKAQDVATAQLGIATAIDAVATAGLGLKHAQADIAGALDSIGGSASGAAGHVKTLQERADDAATAIQGLVTKTGAADQALGHSLAFTLGDQISILQTYANASPLLGAAFAAEIAALQEKLKIEQQKLSNIQQLQVIFGAGAHGRAAGGPVQAHKLFLVGEKGPELFVPDTGGTIVPNHSLRNSRPVGTGSGVRNLNITVEFDPRVARAFIVKAIKDELAVNPKIHGTSISRAT